MQPIQPNTPPDSLIWRIIHFPLVLLVIGIAMMVLGQVGFAAIAGNAIQKAGGWNAVAAATLAAGMCTLVYWVFVRFVERRPTVDEFDASGWFSELGAGVLAGLILFSVVVGVIALFGGYSIVGTHPATVLLPVLAISIVSGVTEEILFRGIFFRILEAWLGTWIALLLSALLFGAGHLGNPNSSLLAGTAIALEAGIMLAALYMLTRRLWAAIGLHAAWNFAQGGVYGIPISGFKQDGLLVPRITGSDLLTGGNFGAEASLPAIIIVTAFGIALLVIAQRRGRFVAPAWVRRQGADAQE